MGHREEQDAARFRKKLLKEQRLAEEDKKMKDGAWRMKWRRTTISYSDLEDILKSQALIDDRHRVLHWAAWPEGLRITTAPDE